MGALEGRVAVVTHAANDIGRAIVARLLAEGAAVVATDSADSTECFPGATWLCHDVTRPDGWAQVFDVVERRFGRLDILVNGIGETRCRDLQDTSLEEFRRIQDVNVFGAFLGIAGAAALMRRLAATGAPASGAIVNLCATASQKVADQSFSFGVSQAASRMLARAAGVELGRKGDGIRANSIILHDSGSGGGSGGSSGGEGRRAAPLGEPVAPTAVADAVLFLAGGEAEFITATDLVVDGGWLAV
jgi:NAD(P)-dependent dehydrogenase (short-subunit alcohol dehydrogenase family)